MLHNNVGSTNTQYPLRRVAQWECAGVSATAVRWRCRFNSYHGDYTGERHEEVETIWRVRTHDSVTPYMGVHFHVGDYDNFDTRGNEK